MPNALVWFRNDLRLNDHPALQAALRSGFTPVPVYIHAPDEEGDWAPGAASNAWRHRSLLALDVSLQQRGSRLNVVHGPNLDALQRAARECNAEAVFWNRRYEPAIEQRDAAIKRTLRGAGLRAESFNGSLLLEPWQVESKQGDPYRVFTPFWRTALAQLRLPASMPAPDSLPSSIALTGALPVEALGLAPDVHWDQAFWTQWTPGEVGAQAALDTFIDSALADYAQARDFPADAGTSRLSPHLQFGEIAPWRIAREIQQLPEAGAVYLRQLGWREFAVHVLHHFPQTPDSNFNPRFDGFPWADVPEATLEAWRHGRTGVPIVDAGMRELWSTGWMHNRVRMIVASFLVKDLHLPWQWGARWFMRHLIDGDLASNNHGWQWAAGTGTDAAPYFRVFNPMLQQERYDPNGEYVARWVPDPVTPMLDHKVERAEALRRLDAIR
ncbi:MAG: deoxyribodipyrimidine photo-lyase [Thermomonas sp.]